MSKLTIKIGGYSATIEEYKGKYLASDYKILGHIGLDVDCRFYTRKSSAVRAVSKTLVRFNNLAAQYNKMSTN